MATHQPVRRPAQRPSPADALVVGVAKRPPARTGGPAADGRRRRPGRRAVIVGRTPAARSRPGRHAARRSASPARPTRSSGSPRPAGSRPRSSSLTGLGDGSRRRYDPETLRRAAGAAARALAGTAHACALGAAGDRRRGGRGGRRPARCSARTRSTASAAATADQAKAAVQTVVLAHRTGPADASRQGARSRTRRARRRRRSALTRDLVNTPPNALTPADVRRASARREATAAGLEVAVLDEKALRKGGYGGILGVGQGSAQPAAAGPDRLPAPARPRGTWRWSARASRSTPAASRIKPARRHGGDEVRHGRRGRGARRRCSRSPRSSRRSTSPAGCRWPRTCPAARVAAPVRRADDVRRQDRRGAQHRRRGPAGPGRRDRRRRRGRPGRDRRRRHADRRRTGRARARGSPAIMAQRRRLPGRGARRGRAASARRSWPMPLPDELRRGLDSQVADIANVDNARLGGMLSGRRVPARVRRPRARRGRTSTSPGRRTTRAAPFGYTPKGGTGVRASAPSSQLAEDMAAGPGLAGRRRLGAAAASARRPAGASSPASAAGSRRRPRRTTGRRGRSPTRARPAATAPGAGSTPPTSRPAPPSSRSPWSAARRTPRRRCGCGRTPRGACGRSDTAVPGLRPAAGARRGREPAEQAHRRPRSPPDRVPGQPR